VGHGLAVTVPSPEIRLPFLAKAHCRTSLYSIVIMRNLKVACSSKPVLQVYNNVGDLSSPGTDSRKFLTALYESQSVVFHGRSVHCVTVKYILSNFIRISVIFSSSAR
jgi:hypothetical protein